MKPKQEYSVKLDLFEGPLDLLLYLVTRAEVAIADIPVAAIAKQYLDYLDLIRELNIEIASEYLSMAATLTRLKAREVLGVEDDEVLEGAEDEIYTRQQLIEKLLEYKKYKEAAGSLRTYESERYGSFPRGKAEEVEVQDDEQQVSLGSVGIFDLISAFKRIVERAGREEQGQHSITPDTVKLDDRIERVLGVLQDQDEVPFEALFEDDMRRIVLVVTFMAILELVKMRKIAFRQEEVFGRIFVRSCIDLSD
ncbi:MAG: segregation/condensation protein A [Chitinivibrionales bacterium]|nr:segregation/condensation protein A [Chitinivibrionales bacterium]MBD3394676.1 segregation/condensation protein A [Chitinivibrionales bacterium]